MQDEMLEKMIRDVLKSMNVQSNDKADDKCNTCNEKVTCKDYPLAQKRKDLVKTVSGKGLDDITLDAVLNGKITPQDIRITANTLILQAEVAESVGRVQFARNLRRAAELTIVPDDRILEIYNAMRPRRSTKEDLLEIAKELEEKYNAKMNAQLIREAADVYERRGILKA